MTDIVSRSVAQPVVADAEASIYAEFDVELAPLRERIAIWAIAAVGPWIGLAWAGRCKGWW